jgi:hypothetical protein
MSQVQINLRVSVAELAVIDRLRLGRPRNTFLRGLIRDADAAARALDEARPGRLVELPRRRVLGSVGENGKLAPVRYAR